MRFVLLTFVLVGCGSDELTLDCQGNFSYTGAFAGSVVDDADGSCTGSGTDDWLGGSYGQEAGGATVQIQVLFPKTNVYVAGAGPFESLARASLFVDSGGVSTFSTVYEESGDPRIDDSGCTGEILGVREVEDEFFADSLLVDFIVACRPLRDSDDDQVTISQLQPSTFLWSPQ
ncbi:MAG: hypothetical protein AB8H79_19655 [Myxococcota bacterium]